MPRAVDDKNPTHLQRQLANQIIRHIRDKNLPPGTPLPEVPLADLFKVSRSPVRAALEQLAARGIVDSISGRGYAVGRKAAKAVATAPLEADESATDALYAQITADFLDSRLEAQFSEADLMRRYEIGHGPLNRVLQRMATDLVIERNPGHGWSFAPAFKSEESENESYRFRAIIEPAALLEPGYKLDRARAKRVRRDHEAIIATPHNKLSRINHFHFYAMNAEFHELLAAGSGNSFLLQALQQQNRLRRLLIYRWSYPLDRIIDSCIEHMELLSAVENGELEWAATLMRRHLELAARVGAEKVTGEPGKPRAKPATEQTKQRH